MLETEVLGIPGFPAIAIGVLYLLMTRTSRRLDQRRSSSLDLMFGEAQNGSRRVTLLQRILSLDK